MLRVSSGFQTLENNKTTRPAASWFQIFLAFGNPIKHSHSFLKYHMKVIKAGVHVKAVLTSLNAAFLPISRSRFKQR